MDGVNIHQWSKRWKQNWYMKYMRELTLNLEMSLHALSKCIRLFSYGDKQGGLCQEKCNSILIHKSMLSF